MHGNGIIIPITDLDTRSRIPDRKQDGMEWGIGAQGHVRSVNEDLGNERWVEDKMCRTNLPRKLYIETFDGPLSYIL